MDEVNLPVPIDPSTMPRKRAATRGMTHTQKAAILEERAQALNKLWHDLMALELAMPKGENIIHASAIRALLELAEADQRKLSEFEFFKAEDTEEGK